VVADMKQLFILTTRLLIRHHEIQEPDNFSFYLNSLVSLCYDSANIGYEAFNHNLKSIVLAIVQSIQSDLNSVSDITSSGQQTRPANSTSTLLKKIIMPLISPMQASEPSGNSLAAETDNSTAVFDSDFKFQRFVVFLVDFIHIIYDKISDTPLAGHDVKSYDQNDEISIFAFAILIHSLSMGLESSARRTKVSGLFRSNLGLIRSQFR
jgi:hypothetical protein